MMREQQAVQQQHLLQQKKQKREDGQDGEAALPEGGAVRGASGIGWVGVGMVSDVGFQ